MIASTHRMNPAYLMAKEGAGPKATVMKTSTEASIVKGDVRQIDGKLVDQERATVSVFDHGLLYGDGVFEGIRSYNGTVFKLDEHISRLYASARAIKLDIPLTTEERWGANWDELKPLV